jgi:hypothetical protein
MKRSEVRAFRLASEEEAMRNAKRRALRPPLLDRVIRFFHPHAFPSHLYSVELPEGVEIRLGNRILKYGTCLVNWLSRTPTGYTGITAPMGVVSQTIFVHTDALSWPSWHTDRVLQHEIAHTQQFKRWGFWGVNIRYIWGLIRYGYGNDAIEREAWDAVRENEG